MRCDAGKQRLNKYDRARVYFAHIIGNDGRKDREHYNYAYNQRAESALFQIAEIYAEAAGKAAAIVDELEEPELKAFQRSLLAQPFILIGEWEKCNGAVKL